MSSRGSEGDERKRLAALHQLEILDTPPDEEFDAIVRAAALVCGTPIALISLVDAERQWFKANLGLTGVPETPRELAFCDHTILGTDIMEVGDAALDDRFADNALVTGAPRIRFYAGMPLRLEDGSQVGSLCVIHHDPQKLDDTQREILRSLGRAAACALESWAAKKRLIEADRIRSAERQRLETLIDAFGLAIWEWNLQADKVQWSDGWRQLLGAMPDGQQKVRDFYHPDDLALAGEAMAAHLCGAADRYRLECRMQHRDGHYIWTQSQGTLVSRTPDGQPEWVFGFTRDITERKLREQALRRSEQFLAQTSRFAAIGGWEIELATGELHWTAESFRIVGLPPGRQPSLEEAMSFFHPETRAIIEASKLHTMESGEPFDFEAPMTRTDGRRIWVRTLGSAVFEGGRPVRMVGAMQDVTREVSQRRALQSAHDRTKQAADSGGIGLFDWDIVADTMQWDDWMCRLYGTTRPASHDAFRVWSQLIHPDDRQTAERAVRDAIEGVRPYNTDFRVIWSDGSVHRLHATGSVIRNQAGTALRLVGTNRDVTQQRQMAADLLRQHELLRVTLNLIDDAVVTTDARGRISWLNPVAERLTGWPASEAVGRAKTEVIRLIDELTRRERPDLVPICIAQGKEMSQAPNAVMVSRYGRECPIENTLAPIRDAHGDVLGVVIVFHDISARRAAASDRQEREHRLSLATAELERLAGHFARARQIAEEASRAKRRFLAGMSHELRTPLNGILGYAQLLRMDGGLTEVQSERLQAMLSSGTHLLEMISCVLDLSEMESESAELQVAPVDLAGLAEALLNIVRPTAQAKSLALDLTIARNVPRRVMTDPARLRQILLNLLGNAVKYTPQGGVALRIGIVPSGSAYAGAGLRLEVTDTGPGIPPGQRHRLFAEFDRLDAEAAGDLEGAGLGLPLTRRLAALLGGQLGYAENPGGGSVFWVEIPLAVEAGSAPPPARAADFVELGLPAPVAATGSSILVVDDVAMNRDIAAAFLRSAAYEVVCAEGGAEAVAAASAEDFLVILMDVRMPEVDGLEATRRIRALSGQRGQVPIVALTAQVFAEQVEACREAGMDTHLAKPFTLETLLGAIARGVAAARERVPYTPQNRLGAENATVDFSSGALGENLPILDETMFDRTSAVLDPEAVQGYLTSLGGRMQALRQLLGLRDGSPAASAALVEAAHALAGSAGMFGFDRLVFVARHVERSVKMDEAQATRLANDLDLALSASLAILHRRTMLVAEPA